jgi:hypothetical protein
MRMKSLLSDKIFGIVITHNCYKTYNCNCAQRHNNSYKRIQLSSNSKGQAYNIVDQRQRKTHFNGYYRFF